MPAPGRYRVLALVCVLSMITYLDRVCFAAAAPFLVTELSLASVADLKWAFTAFAISYAVFEIPGGWLGDRLGPRSTLIRIVLWWSVCTALTGLVGIRLGGLVFGGLTTLIVIRFLFGAGEAGAYPNITRAIHNWFPAKDWAFAQGCVWMSGRVMGGLTPLVWAVLVSGTSASTPLVTWRGAFLLFGAIGVVWCVVFARSFRNHPPSLEVKREASHAVPWRAMSRSRTLWAVCLMYGLVTYGWYFNITYLPAYMNVRFDLKPDSELGAVYKGGPLWVGAAGCVLGGVLAGRLTRWFGKRRGRAVLGVGALSLTAACWSVAASATSVEAFFLTVSAAAFCIALPLGATWAPCQDIGGRNAAVTAATMNMVGTFGAATAGWVTGTIIERALAARPVVDEVSKRAAILDGFHDCFVSFAAVYVVAAACWLVIDPDRELAG